MISYAQNFEDIILQRALGHVKEGAYLDIGANDPVHDSVSLAFYERGWRGVHVEPMPVQAQALRAARPDETVLEVAVGTTEGNVQLFAFEGTGLTTGIEAFAEQHVSAGHALRELSVPSVRLSSVLERFRDTELHWMKIDVEGMEADVLSSWDASPVRPWVLLIESTLPNSPVQNHEEWQDAVFARGYEFAYFDGLNRFYVHQDHRELLKSFGPGPNFFDKFQLSGNSPFVGHLREEIGARRRETEQVQAQLANLSAIFQQQAAGIAQAIEQAREQASNAALAGAELAQTQAQQRIGALELELERLSRDQDALRQELSQRSADLRDVIGQNSRLLDEISSSRDSAATSLAALNKDLQRTAAKSATLAEERNDALERLASVESETKKSLIASAQERDALRNQLQVVRQHRAQAMDHIEAMSRQMEHLRGQSQGMADVADMAALRDELDQLRQSTFWRMTSPLRWMVDRLRRMAFGARDVVRRPVQPAQMQASEPVDVVRTEFLPHLVDQDVYQKVKADARP